MGAANPERRSKTARELAEQFGASTRTIRRIIAEPRTDYETRAADKRRYAQKLRADGFSYKQIAEEMKISEGSVSSLLHHPRPKTKAG